MDTFNLKLHLIYKAKSVFIFFILLLLTTNIAFGKNLLTAVAENDLNKVVELLENGANPNIVFKGNSNVYFTSTVEGVSLDHRFIKHGATPLHIAIHDSGGNGQEEGSVPLEILDILLNKGANPHHFPMPYIKDWDSPLRMAIDLKRLEATKALLKAGALPHHLLRATQISSLEIVKTLLEAGANSENSHLSAAIQRNHLGIVKVLLKAKAPPNNSNLSEAVQNNSFGIVKTLLDAGVDPNFSPEPLLILAIQHRSLRMVTALLDAGIDVNQKDEQGRTALKVIVEYKLTTYSYEFHNTYYHNDLNRIKTIVEKAEDKACAQSLLITHLTQPL